MAKNAVIGGDYEGMHVFCMANMPAIGSDVPLNRDTVDSVDLIDDNYRKSAKSGLARGIVGGALFGTAGMIAGGLSAKNKGTYHVAVYFKDGKRSLLELDDKHYKVVMRACF